MTTSNLRIIGYALRQWGGKHDNYSLTIGQRIFYTLKLVVCLIINRSKHFTHNDYEIDQLVAWGETSGATQDGTWYSWEYASVGGGLLNWYFQKGSDGS